VNHPLFDPDAAKKATNLSVNSDLLRLARAERINLSRLFEERLAEVLRERQRAAWRQRNRAAVTDYNERVARDGVFSDGLRRF